MGQVTVAMWQNCKCNGKEQNLMKVEDSAKQANNV